MMLRNLVGLLFWVGLAWGAHVKIGHYDPKTGTWSGYNPACDEQCRAQKGEVCGANVRSCCSKNACENKLGFNICKTPLPQYVCYEGLKSRKLDDYL